MCSYSSYSAIKPTHHQDDLGLHFLLKISMHVEEPFPTLSQSSWF
jgi:hypothetical protein